MPTYLAFWGKAKADRPSEPSWHPIAYHCLDVAAIADVLLVANPRRLAALANLLQTSTNNARHLLVCLIALHDVGKFTAAFQSKSVDAWPSAVLGAYACYSGGRHDEDGYAMGGLLGIRELLAPVFSDWDRGEIFSLWAATTGHHGQPATGNGPDALIQHFKTIERQAALAFAQDIVTLFKPFSSIPIPDPRKLAIVSWAVAGLTVIADWIGANREYFPYQAPKDDLPTYWSKAQSLAKSAVARSGIQPIVASLGDWRVLLQGIAELSPLQQMAVDMKLPQGPVLAIVEDVTGSGKTEAALLLASRLLADGRADGLFFALPTMATANAMYERLGKSYRRMFAQDATPSLVLAHGRRALNAGFTSSILDGATEMDDVTAATSGDESSATCAAWIADDRRKAFLAHIGVGTIDQAILGVLPSRHQSLRLWGLADRVLVIDEAHAYDAFMSREIETLLEFQAALGGSGIVLSATLAASQRRALVGAFSRGLNGTATRLGENSAYPMLTMVSADGATDHPVGSRDDRRRVLPVRRIASFGETLDYVEHAARLGASVAWIRNSVDDAIEAAYDLRARKIEVVLLHARFAMGERLDIEHHVRAVLGPRDKAGRRKGFVLVGTQILEQSLDYDVDAMVTDLAPIDLMIQRAGRLWRHPRPKDSRPLASPELLVLSPDPDAVFDRNWYRQISSRAAAVYDHHGIVWRSAKALFGVAGIATPDGVRSLVESVYSDTVFDDVPDELRSQTNLALGKRSGARSFAKAQLLEIEPGYGGSADLWMRDDIIATRLGQRVTVFRLGKMNGHRVAPWYEGEGGEANSARNWALSEVSLNQKKASGVPEPVGRRARMIKGAKASWPAWEREMPLLLLQEGPEGEWRGSVVDRTGKEGIAIYRSSEGLSLSS